MEQICEYSILTDRIQPVHRLSQHCFILSKKKKNQEIYN